METIRDVLVVKVGTSTLTETQTDGSERLDSESFQRIGKQIVELQDSGTHVVLVSSAAITAGMAATGLTARPDKATGMHELQRLASIGWRGVMNEWSGALAGNAGSAENSTNSASSVSLVSSATTSESGRTIGELLLTNHELKLESEREEALRVAHTLLSHGDIPIVNENDAITHKEISFGDNDTLAAQFAACIGRSALFDCRVRLVVLSDVHGVYADKGDESTVIGQIDDIQSLEHLAGGARSKNSVGGMATKFAAAKIATANGVEMWIAHGRSDNAIQRALDGDIGTRFSLATHQLMTNCAQLAEVS